MITQDSESYQLLVIEDSDKDFRQIEEMLKSQSEVRYALSHADRLATGLQMLASSSFDIVLLDLFLPETKGLRTLDKLFERIGQMAVVVLTKLDDENAGINAVRHGAQEYLIKGSFDSYNLLRAIRHAIERNQIETSLRESEKRHRELNHQLQSANKELESFSYSVSHDLRAPLRAITGFSEILDTRFRETLPEEAHHYLDNIILAGNQMGELLDDLLAYSRLGKGSLSYSECKLDDIFKTILLDNARTIEAAGAIIEIEPDLPTMTTNSSLVRQIFNNLLTNAVKFMADGVVPKVTVSSCQQGDSVSISVADNGIGIAPEQLNRIFNVFQRLHSQDEYPGTGIGLSIVEKSVHLLHGTIQIQSTPGKGSTFTVELPIVTPYYHKI